MCPGNRDRLKLSCANSPQAKGRVERVNATLQDRLLRSCVCATSQRLKWPTPSYRSNSMHNSRFATQPVSTFDAHRPPEPVHDLARILSRRQKRTLSAKGIVSYEGRLFAVDERDFRRLSNRKIDVRLNAANEIVLEQGERPLKFVELANVSTRPPITTGADRRVPNPKKAHTYGSRSPLETSLLTSLKRRQGTSLMSSRNHLHGVLTLVCAELRAHPPPRPQRGLVAIFECTSVSLGIPLAHRCWTCVSSTRSLRASTIAPELMQMCSKSSGAIRFFRSRCQFGTQLFPSRHGLRGNRFCTSHQRIPQRRKFSDCHAAFLTRSRGLRRE